MILTQELVRDLFDYCDGAIYWKQSPKFDIPSGARAGTAIGNRRFNYRMVGIGGRRKYPEHRIIYLWHFGELPEMVDHIDGNPLNNKIENLRAATRSDNNTNRCISTRNTSGHKGVSWNASHQKWLVQINHKSKYHFIGYFSDLDEAIHACKEARASIHGAFARDA